MYLYFPQSLCKGSRVYECNQDATFFLERSNSRHNNVHQENGLVPIRTATWGPFVLISLGENKAMGESSTIEEAWLGSAAPIMVAAGIDTSLQHVATREYLLNCNWKVKISLLV